MSAPAIIGAEVPERFHALLLYGTKYIAYHGKPLPYPQNVSQVLPVTASGENKQN
jgi:hypothetical protein